MRLSRRFLLAATPALAAARAVPSAWAQTADPRLGPRELGDPKAKVIVDEWFSLTCTHCGHFAREIFPQVRTKLIDTGKVRYRFHDFPLDQVALLAAMVARSLPVERYEPFIDDLLTTQDSWAFAQGVDPVEELRKHAVMAGVSRAEFDRINADDAFRQAIVNRQDQEGKFLNIEGTPYFRINDQPAPGVVSSYDAFAQAVEKAS